MKIVKTSNLSSRKKDINQYDRNIDNDVANTITVLQGRVRFGNSTSGFRGENIQGEFKQFTSSTTPDAENTVSHTIGAVPIGIIILWQDKAGSLYQGPSTGTAWTSSNIYLKCSVASVTFLLFIVQ